MWYFYYYARGSSHIGGWVTTSFLTAPSPRSKEWGKAPLQNHTHHTLHSDIETTACATLSIPPPSANVRGLFFSWFRIEIEIKRERGKGLGVLFYWGWGGGCLSSAFAMVAITSLHHWAKRQIRPRPTVYPPFFNFPFLPPLTGGYSPKKKTGG